ncbi:MAG: RidA family protein [Gammaproteobacteria bacterium]|jgi:reactive intermediate/imine deaminase
MSREIIKTDKAPQAIGTYSQAVKTGTTVYLSGQIPLVPETMEMVEGDMEAQVRRVFDNLQAVAQAAGGSLDDIAKLNIFLTDLGNFALVNTIMAEYFNEPYPARAAIGVASLPRGAGVEMDAVMELV